MFLNINIKDINKAFKDARAGLYTYIFISLELANTLDFCFLFKDPEFKKQLALIIVNKIYLVMQWGKKFCPEYMQLYYVRNLIGNSVLWFICFAIFNLKTLKMVKKSLGFNNANMHFK